ncbi:TraB/GumN family protein [Epibacterium ulvae]|uniref:TraB/GumN family protein n=1 Tax=Epibacterium ulvae TaxID=1156985 RepID=UPI00248F697E|nr:TraB/GumN family protein [Epibacterium ulvae]
MIKLLSFLTACLLATQTYANCRGVDYREHLPTRVETWLEQQMTATPFAKGNHWIARKENKTLHIIGTIHGGDARLSRIMRGLRPVVAQADAVYFEVTSADIGPGFEAQLLQNPQNFLLPNGTTLERYMSADGWMKFKSWAASMGLDLTVVARLPPWMISSFVVQSGCRAFGFGNQRGLDDRIERFATRKQIPIAALETIGTGLQALTRIPLRDQVRLLENDLERILTKIPEDATAVEAYFEQSTWQAFLLQHWIASQYSKFSPAETKRLHDSVNESLLDWRNRLWLPQILDIPEETAVVAVGAAHLPGRNGILNLLRQRGFTLSTAPF